MKKLLFAALATMLLASCSAPKYTYHFDHYDYNSGRKGTVAVAPEQASPISVDATIMTADAAPAPTVASVPSSNTRSAEEQKETFAKKYSEMSKAEKKQFRSDVKKEMKAYAKALKKGEGVKAESATMMDNDLKLAIIFGAVGLTLTLFGGISEAFWILGVIAIVVGVVFLIKWLVRQ
jgi:hypothetical protein